MARIKLSYPDEVFSYTTHMTVRSSDVNAAAHLANDRLVGMVTEAGLRLWADSGLFDPETGTARTIVTDLAITYLAEVRVRQHLRFDVGVTDLNRYGGDMAVRVTRVDDGVVVAVAKVGFVCFDLSTRTVQPMDEDVAEALTSARPRPVPIPGGYDPSGYESGGYDGG